MSWCYHIKHAGNGMLLDCLKELNEQDKVATLENPDKGSLALGKFSIKRFKDIPRAIKIIAKYRKKTL